MLDAATAAAASAATAEQPRIERRRRLSQAALAVTNQKVRPAYSPVVIAGAVRLADFVLLSIVGVALYFAYVVHLKGFSWEYVASIFGMSATAVICFQASDIYEVQVFRGQLRQMTRMISAWAFVFLLFIGASFFAKLGGEVSRLWLSAFFFVGLAALIAERLLLRAMVRSWAREGRLDRRTIIVGSDQNGEKLVEALRDRRPIPTSTSSACSTTAMTAARSIPAPAPQNSARSTTSSNSPAAPASTSCCSRCRSRRKPASSTC